MKQQRMILLVLGCIFASVSLCAGSTNLPFGVVVTGSISSAGGVNVYTLNGNLDEFVNFTIVASGISPKFQLYAPSGILIASASNGYCSGGTLEMNSTILPTTGSFVLDVSDCSNTNTGSYSLYAQSTNQPVGAQNLPFAQVQSGTLTSSAQTNTYTFSANTNDVLDFTMVTTSGGISPKIRVYEPDGALLSAANNGYCSGGTLELNSVTIPQAGIYTVLFADCSDTNTGNYVIYTQRINNPFGAENLPFAQVTTGAISSAAQSNTYTFSANQDDVFDLTTVTTSGGVSPKIRIYDANGTLLTQAWDGYCSGSTLEMNTVTLPFTGTYTLLFGDCADTNTGNYNIYMQRTNNPSGAQNLPLAQVTSGALSSAAQSNTYSFSANQNDVFDFTTVTTSGGISPKIRIYDANGTLLTQAWNGYCSGSTLEMNTVIFPFTGTYTLLFGDCADTNTGNYDIYMQRTDNPSAPVALSFGATKTGSIASQAQSNTYTFSANTNDVLDFTMVTTSGGISPKIRIYDPNGTLLTQAWNGYCSGSTLELNTVTIPSSGAYTVLFGDCADTNTGNYVIYTQRTNNPSGATTVLFGPAQTGTISSAAQSNTYNVNANEDDVFDFTVVTTSGGISPKIRIYDPNGALLSQAWNGYCSGSTLEMNTVTLPFTGVYSMLIGDCSDVNTGNYEIYGQSTNNPFGPGPVLWGQTQTGNIASQALSNTYIFSGTANNIVTLSMTTTSGSLSPKIRLYQPDGVLLASANEPYCSGSSTSISSLTLPEDGYYVALLGDCSDVNSGSYNLTSQCTGTCPTMPTISWPTPAPIAWPKALGGTQLNATANVGGSFAYSPASGTVLSPGPQDLSLTFTPNDTTDYSTAIDRVQLTVKPAVTSSSVTSSLNPSTFGQSVTFTATVTSSGGTPTGTVTFKDGSTTLGTGNLSGGKATFNTTTLGAGSHSITAVYGGSQDFAGSTSAVLSQTVNQAASSTFVISSLNPSTFGQSVTFTATVISSYGTPTGTVTFKDGSTTLGTGKLSSSQAKFTTSSLSVGTHSITAVYGGSTNFSGSTSSVLSQVVNQ